MTGTVRIQGADLYATNKSGNNYASSVQASTGRRSKLHKAIVSNLGALDVYLWLYDLAAGTSGSVGPRVVMLCPSGVCSTLDLTDGQPYVNGIYAFLSTSKPPDANTAPTDAGNNAAILDLNYRLE